MSNSLYRSICLPLCFGRASRDQSGGAGDWEASPPPASPLDLGVEVLLQLEDVLVLLLQAQAGDGPRQGQLGGAHTEDTEDGHHLQQPAALNTAQTLCKTLILTRPNAY